MPSSIFMPSWSFALGCIFDAGYVVYKRPEHVAFMTLCSEVTRTLQHVRVMALAPSLRFPFSRPFFALTPLPSRWALGLALLTLDALAFCRRGIEMRSHGINDGMKIDIRVDK